MLFSRCKVPPAASMWHSSRSITDLLPQTGADCCHVDFTRKSMLGGGRTTIGQNHDQVLFREDFHTAPVKTLGPDRLNNAPPFFQLCSNYISYTEKQLELDACCALMYGNITLSADKHSLRIAAKGQNASLMLLRRFLGESWKNANVLLGKDQAPRLAPSTLR